MARNKIKIARLVDERRRLIVLQRRRKMIYKKAEELSILCDIEIGIVIFSPDQETNDDSFWPSRDKFKQVLMMFLDKPLQRFDKLITYEGYVRKEIDAKVKNLRTIQKKTTEINEIEQLFNKLYLGEKTVYEIDNRQVRSVYNMATKIKEKIHERRKQLNLQQDQHFQLPVYDPLALRLAPLNVHDQCLHLPVDDPLGLGLATPVYHQWK